MSGDQGRLLADEDVPAPVVRHLRRLGYDVVEIRQEGLEKWATFLTDDAVHELARNQRRVILTGDKDFKEIARMNPGHAGIVWCAKDLDFRQLATRILSGRAAT